MRVKIIPHGALIGIWPEGVELEASTPREAMNGYMLQHKIARPPGKTHWDVVLLGYEPLASLDCPLTTAELHVVPHFAGGGGGGSGGWVKIAIGVALIAASFIPGLQGVAWAGLVGMSVTATSITVATTMFVVGVSVALSGVMEMLSPAPKMNTPNMGSGTESEGSKYLGAAKNTVKSGTRKPLAFGRVRLYGHYISFDVESDPQAILGQPPNADQRRKTGTYRVGYAT